MRYAVTLRGLTASEIHDEVKSIGGRNMRVALASKQVFCDLNEDQAKNLRSKGFKVTAIRRVITDSLDTIGAVTPPTPQAGRPIYTTDDLLALAGLDQLKYLFTPPPDGEGYNLAIIDTGIRETHEAIRGRVVYNKNFTSDPMEDGFDHGTGVCSIALAIAPKCNILNLKVLDSNGVGTEEEVALAVDDCISLLDTDPDIAPHVINLSLGSPDDGDPDNPVRVACREAIARGIYVIAAAGNQGPAPQTINCPACDELVVAVGSVRYESETETFSVSYFSSRGPTQEGLIKPDVVFFGEDVVVASSANDSATTAKSGTSFTAPDYSGMAVLYLQGMSMLGTIRLARGVSIPSIHPSLQRPATQEEMLNVYLPLATGKPPGTSPGKDNDYGYGIPYGPHVMSYISRIFSEASVSQVLSIAVPLVGMGMLGMMMASVSKAVR